MEIWKHFQSAVPPITLKVAWLFATRITLLMLIASLTLITLGAVGQSTVAEEVDFVRDVRPILKKHCYSCHSGEDHKSGLRLDIKAAALSGGELYGPLVVAGKPDESPLVQFVADENADLQMPPKGEPLAAAEIETLKKWVAAGAVWPDGVDEAELVDRRDHWSFHAVKPVEVPTPEKDDWSRNEIDRFILSRLREEGLRPSAEASRVAWLRRVSFDLIGLPPTPEQVSEFINDESPDAYERVVEQLLKSPRYGERWGQHWLDVVRYADTHGFEVNTERPNAWPYRDYVIEAFNNDTPYDQFVREQIVGDALQQDAATGFLVTASVLLPGQIGKDDASKRLARQDSIDEMVVNISQSFLGLSIGCARCHNHKFDPISQEEYYAMQAFVAGVEYADRSLPKILSESDRQLEQVLRSRIEALERELAGFVPLASLDAGSRQPTDAKLNEIDFEPQSAKFVRFTIHDANLHPSLGLIEPCIDEFEIYTEAAQPRNVALATLGAKVVASGSRVSANHRLEHINDGKYGNGSSWMSDQAGQGWVLFELPEETLISKVVWSRDRDGHYNDRLATAYTLEVGASQSEMQTVAVKRTLRPAVHPQKNDDRFAPVEAKQLRFTIAATNRLAPCLDELEVFDDRGRNIALASHGTKVTSTGDNTEPNRHELRFLNDGNYGNSRSWMSSQDGKGSVTLEFEAAATIDRVVWSRDREGKFADRLATEYQIEVAGADGEWKLVASSGDRKDFDPKLAEQAPSVSVGSLEPAAREAFAKLESEREKLAKQLAELSQPQLAFAGTFRKPDTIHLLRRGDPEQPQEEVSAEVPEVLAANMQGEMSITDAATDAVTDAATEQQRRGALADWIVRPDNPLTARVMINRIWQGHFGVGLVDTPNDFGRNGSKPTHPELLDWLAAEFIREGWSIKQMHRKIVLSATYRQSMDPNEAATEKDADVRLLWRYPSRRLEGEAIRDAVLAVSGNLNLQMGGPGFNLFDKRGGLTGFNPVEKFDANGLRRMIYAHKVRRERDAVFGAFDCPDAGQSTPRRRESTTPIQALNLLNSQFMLDQSVAFAERVQQEAGEDVSQQIDRVYQLALNRSPTDREQEQVQPVVKEHGLETLCRAILNSNEFLFLP